MVKPTPRPPFKVGPPRVVEGGGDPLGLFVLCVCVGMLMALPFTGCHGFADDVDPKATAQSADYPCGVIGETCAMGPGGDWHGAVCCWQGEACIKDPAPPGFTCEDDRPLEQGPMYGRALPDGGAPSIAPHRRPARVTP